MKQSLSLNYFRIKSYTSNNSIEPVDLNEFSNYIDAQQIRTVFIVTGPDAEKPKSFAAFHNHLMILQDCMGYNTVEDFRNAKEHGFAESKTFYTAQKEGYKYFDDWQLVQQAGIGDKLIFDKMKSQGYIEGYNEFKQMQNGNAAIQDTFKIENAYHLYTFASKNGFSDYKHFKEAFSKGFTEAVLYDAAMEKKFNNASDYNSALKMGFANGTDYYFAVQSKVRDANDMKRFVELEFMKEGDLTHDQRVLLGILSKLEYGKKISINKLYEYFRTNVVSYLFNDTKKMPEWFTVGLKDRGAVVDFLKTNEQVKKFGEYDKDGEFFEALKLQNRKVVIDGSNVAHNSHGDGKSKPKVDNLIRMVNELKNKGFSDIFVIADASLRHRFADAEKLKALEEICHYKTAPAETPADVYLIQYVKRFRCLIISNDLFRDWKMRDYWVADNIDFYRLSFMIDDDTVMLPDIK